MQSVNNILCVRPTALRFHAHAIAISLHPEKSIQLSELCTPHITLQSTTNEHTCRDRKLWAPRKCVDADDECDNLRWCRYTPIYTCEYILVWDLFVYMCSLYTYTQQLGQNRMRELRCCEAQKVRTRIARGLMDMFKWCKVSSFSYSTHTHIYHMFDARTHIRTHAWFVFFECTYISMHLNWLSNMLIAMIHRQMFVHHNF